MKLQFLDTKNFTESITYKILYLDTPFYKKSGSWIDSDYVKENLIYALDILLFEEVLIEVLYKSFQLKRIICSKKFL